MFWYWHWTMNPKLHWMKTHHFGIHTIIFDSKICCITKNGSILLTLNAPLLTFLSLVICYKMLYFCVDTKYHWRGHNYNLTVYQTLYHQCFVTVYLFWSFDFECRWWFSVDEKRVFCPKFEAWYFIHHVLRNSLFCNCC